MIGLEERLAVGLEQRVLADVGVGVVDERAGLDVAAGVDVQEAASARDAAADVFAVVPEIHREEGLRLAELAHLAVHALARDEIRLRAALPRHLVDERNALGLRGQKIIVILGRPLEKLARAGHRDLGVSEEDERADVEIVRHLADRQIAGHAGYGHSMCHADNHRMPLQFHDEKRHQERNQHPHQHRNKHG